MKANNFWLQSVNWMNGILKRQKRKFTEGGLERAIITCLETEDEKTYYFCDVTKKSLTNLSTLTDRKIDGAFFADHDTLLLVQVSEDQKSCSVFTYDVTTGKLVQTLCRENYFLQDYGTYSIANYGMMFFGGPPSGV